MPEEDYQRNVLGEKLEECSNNPVTGFFEMVVVTPTILIVDYILFA